MPGAYRVIRVDDASYPTICLDVSLVSLQAASRLFCSAESALELASSALVEGLWLNEPVR